MRGWGRRAAICIWSLLDAGHAAEIAQLGERQTEDLEVPGSIPGLGKFLQCCNAMINFLKCRDFHVKTLWPSG